MIFSLELRNIMPLKPWSNIWLQISAISCSLFADFNSGMRYWAPQLAYTYFPLSNELRSTAFISSFPSRSSSRKSGISDSLEFLAACWYSSSSMCRVAPTMRLLKIKTWFMRMSGSLKRSRTRASESMWAVTSRERKALSTSLSRFAEAQILFISRKVSAKSRATSSVYSRFISWRPLGKS